MSRDASTVVQGQGGLQDSVSYVHDLRLLSISTLHLQTEDMHVDPAGPTETQSFYRFIYDVLCSHIIVFAEPPKMIPTTNGNKSSLIKRSSVSCASAHSRDGTRI